jgi:hypothetical protein
VVKKGKTLVLAGDEARQLLASIDTSAVVGLCDRDRPPHLLSAALAMNVEDYYPKASAGGSGLRNNMETQLFYRQTGLGTSEYVEKRLGKKSDFAHS